MTRYFEDIAVGETERFGSYEVTRDEIVAFAERWDPQPFHLDEDAAEDSMFGGLVASGWHTACICMRLMVDGYLSDAASMGSPGIDELRWLEPVRPGDVLSVRVEVLDKRASEGMPGTGIVQNEWVVEDADETPKMRMTSPGFIAMEDGGDDDG
jgi:acyl dehydratase